MAATTIDEAVAEMVDVMVAAADMADEAAAVAADMTVVEAATEVADMTVVDPARDLDHGPDHDLDPEVVADLEVVTADDALDHDPKDDDHVVDHQTDAMPVPSQRVPSPVNSARAATEADPAPVKTPAKIQPPDPAPDRPG